MHLQEINVNTKRFYEFFIIKEVILIDKNKKKITNT